MEDKQKQKIPTVEKQEGTYLNQIRKVTIYICIYISITLYLPLEDAIRHFGIWPSKISP